VIGVSVAALAGTALLVRGLGSEFLPRVDDGSVGVSISLPAGSTPEQTNAIALEVEQMVAEMPHVQSVFTTAGGFLFGGSTAGNAGRGSLDIRLVAASERDIGAEEWVSTLQQRIAARGFPGARVYVRPPRIRGLRTSFSGSDVSIAIQGDDLAELQRIAREVAATLRGTPGLENMEASTEEASPVLAVRLDRERAGYLGLSVADVGQTLRTALDGSVATRYAEGNREFDVRVRLPRDKFTSSEDLGAVALYPGGSGRAPVFLRDVADVSLVLGPTSIRRENQNRILRINGDVIAEIASIGVVTDSIRRRIAAMELPDGYGIVLGGEDEAIRENNRQLTIVMMLAVFLVFVVMAIQYESVLNPLVILVAIPLSLIGVGVALWLTGTPLSAPVLLGVIMLAGIVVNNSILLVEYAEEYRRERGASLEQAVIDAGSVRLRPILMTTLTTLFGMLPLALGLGEGSEMMQPLAIAVIGGLAVSTILTLLVVPGTYVAVHTAGNGLKAWLTGHRPTAGRAPEATPVAGD
jgi:multidrug efflux pump subunit AcrB